MGARAYGSHQTRRSHMISETGATNGNTEMRVLVADDNRDAAKTMGYLLESWGYEPTVCYDGNSALAWLRQTPELQLALLDWNMPGKDGIDVCREMRQDRSHAYVYTMLVTGRTDKDQMLEGLNA